MKNLMRIHCLSIVLLFGGLAATAQSLEARQGGAITPVVLFPGFHLTTLKVAVVGQSTAPGCPVSGTFEDFFPNSQPSPFSQICKDKLLTLVYDADPAKPMPERFSNQPGVFTWIGDFGNTASAPFYEPLYLYLESHGGYTRDLNIRVAGYDGRLTPDMDNFLNRTIALIEKTYRDNGNTPVHLIGHSNGPLYTQYLLTHTSQAWKNKYIHGFSPLAGNWTGQGSLYSILFTGLNVANFFPPQDPANAASSARMYQSHPSSYMSAADPKIFGNQEVVVETLNNGKSYTPEDGQKLFHDAGLGLARTLGAYYIGFVKFTDPGSFPNVDIYAEKGSGLPTMVGAVLQDLTVGQVLDINDPLVFILRDGDANQEDITNDSIQVWSQMPCFRFELTDNSGVDHFSLTSHRPVMDRLLSNIQRPKSVCP
jgi:lecithin-cholesterol acyltransferase